ncbi:MAG: NB-ARC domain-containing protein [Cyanobacteria bacterium J06560_2]
MKKLDLNAALRWVNAAVSTHAGHALREPEIVILKGTWRGLTYEQMANDSEYSTNYLMRDVAPKLWKQLSGVFDRSVGKTNFRVALEAYAAANVALEPDSLSATEGARPLPNQVLSDQGLGVAAKRQEASHGWISEGALWGAVGASVLSAAAISPSAMYGYEGALTQLNDWLAEAAGVEGQSHLIGVWGLRGVGKTLLVETAVAHSGDLFEGIIWRSLQDQPTLNELSVSILTSLGLVVPPVQATAQLLSIMANRSLLIVLEGVEALLEPDSLVGAYLPEQSSYNDFFQSVVSSRSCVVLTGIEGPSALLRQGGFGSKDGVRSLVLNGLSAEAATELLQSERLLASEQWNELAARYQGHPLALKSAARVIREIFNGRVDTFLSQSSTLFKGIFKLF